MRSYLQVANNGTSRFIYFAENFQNRIFRVFTAAPKKLVLYDTYLCVSSSTAVRFDGEEERLVVRDTAGLHSRAGVAVVSKMV